MNKTFFPSKIQGTVTAPASKSFFQRAIALAILSNKMVEICNVSKCNDAQAALDIAKRFGCKLIENENTLMVDASSVSYVPELHCGESGLGIRMFTPLAALFEKPIRLTAQGSLLKRPVGFMQDPLVQLGVKTDTADGFPPITVHGPLKGGNAIIDGSLSSQFLTGLLIALPKATLDTHLVVNNLTSVPYIDMTLQSVSAFGGIIEHQQYREFFIKGNQHYQTSSYWVEGDWSGAAGLLIAGAIAGHVRVEGLNMHSTQADSAVLQPIEQSGAKITIHNNQVSVSKAADYLKPFSFDATHCPDLFPVLTALAANCVGTSKIKGVHRLVHKESNRALALKNEFNKIGISIEIQEDIMLIIGGKINSGIVSSHHDHRIAMAMVLAALTANGPIVIEDSECVSKSYPAFYDDMFRLGVKLQNEG